MIIPRTQSKSLLTSALYFPVVAILGPRQSGKTTLARNLFKDHKYVNLEEIALKTEALADPRGFLTTYSNEYGIILDEFQNVPSLLPYIQTFVDEHQKPGYFILTGSQNFLMNQAITQTLAGRIAIHTLLPLSITELKNADMLPQRVEELIYKGCYPPIYARNTPPNIWYPSYTQTYLEKDIRQLTQVTDLTLFQTFVQLCAGRIGQLLNLTSLGNDCGVSDKTARQWLSLLEASYIIFLLQPYYKNFNKRLIKSPKLYFYDTGLACSLLRIKPDEVATHYLKGSLFESLIISDLLKHYYNAGVMPRAYFWGDRSAEVDCILDEGLLTIPIEIKASYTPSLSFFDNLTYWNTLAHGDPTKSFVIYAGSENQRRSVGNLVSWKDIDTMFRAFDTSR